MTRSKKGVIIWTKGIDDLLEGNGQVGGLTVQMMHWANIFVKNNWEVISLTKSIEYNNHTKGNIKFKYLKKPFFLNILFEPFIIFWFIYKNKPSLIISRGASRSQFALVLASKILRIKLVLMLASDTDVKKGEELITKPWDRTLFQLGLKNTKYIIAQNRKQQYLANKVKNNNKVILIPNIWPINNTSIKNGDNTILWVANFKGLKRPEWFLDLAEELPDYNFTMVGKSIDNKLFDQCKTRALQLPNVTFLGGLSFFDTEELFTQHKLFVCTSEIEGFPNTFLQAWANGVPVVTSFDPSDIVKNKKLGMSIATLKEAKIAISNILTNDQKYDEIQNSINTYFKEAHDSQNRYEQLIRMISQ